MAFILLLHVFELFIVTRVSQDSYPSASQHKCNAVPGAPPSKFVMSEKPNMELVMWCKGQNVFNFTNYSKSVCAHNSAFCKKSHENKSLLINICPCIHNLCEKIGVLMKCSFQPETAVNCMYRSVLKFCKNVCRGTNFQWAYVVKLSNTPLIYIFGQYVS